MAFGAHPKVGCRNTSTFILHLDAPSGGVTGRGQIPEDQLRHVEDITRTNELNNVYMHSCKLCTLGHYMDHRLAAGGSLVSVERLVMGVGCGLPGDPSHHVLHVEMTWFQQTGRRA